MRCFVLAGFLLTSASRDPSAIAEFLVHWQLGRVLQQLVAACGRAVDGLLRASTSDSKLNQHRSLYEKHRRTSHWRQTAISIGRHLRVGEMTRKTRRTEAASAALSPLCWLVGWNSTTARYLSPFVFVFLPHRHTDEEENMSYIGLVWNFTARPYVRDGWLKMQHVKTPFV